jgi:hypothetical protein
LGVHMRIRKLWNVLPSGAFWPEVTLWNVTRSDCMSREPFGVPLGARMRDRKCPCGVLYDIMPYSKGE